MRALRLWLWPCLVGALASTLHCGRALSDAKLDADAAGCLDPGCVAELPDSKGQGGADTSPPSPLEPTNLPRDVCRDSEVAGGRRYVRSQADLDALRGCEVADHLAIHVFSGADLEPLSSLRSVRGGLTLIQDSGPSVADPLRFLANIEDAGSLALDFLELDGFAALNRIRLGELSIEACQGFSTLEGLEARNLQLLELRDMPQLHTLTGLAGHTVRMTLLRTGIVNFEGMRITALELSLIQNPELVSLAGVNRALESLRAQDNPKLSTLGVDRATVTLKELQLESNPSLTNLLGLEGVRRIETLSIVGNPALSTLEGLQGLSSAGAITLSSNPLESLEGLRGLEEVDVLNVRYSGTEPSVSTPGLSSLSGLRRLRRAGTLDLFDNPRLSTLQGIEQAEVASFSLSCGSDLMTTLDGFTAPERMIELRISSCPALTDIAALQPLVEVDYLQIFASGLTDLDALSNLRRAIGINLSDSALTQIEGLANLESVSYLSLDSLPTLRSLPTFANLATANDVSVSRLEILETGPNFPALDSSNDILFEQNPRLARVDGFPLLYSVGTLNIQRNQLLSEIAFPGLVSANSLSVMGNPSLPPEQLGELASVSVPGERVLLEGPLDPCPWSEDGTCDEVPGFCAIGTDIDCR